MKIIRRIKINMSILNITNHDNGIFYQITDSNGAGLYGCKNLETGKYENFTRNEIKKMGGNIWKIEETIELLKLNNYDLDMFVDDDGNYITAADLGQMEKLGIDISEYKKVEFEIVEG